MNMRHHPAALLRCAATFSFVLGIVGCATAPKLDPQKVALAQAEIGALRDDPSKVEQPPEIVDVHTHMFNGRYLPVRGIIAGRYDDTVPVWMRVLGIFFLNGNYLSQPDVDEFAILLHVATYTSRKYLTVDGTDTGMPITRDWLNREARKDLGMSPEDKPDARLRKRRLEILGQRISNALVAVFTEGRVADRPVEEQEALLRIEQKFDAPANYAKIAQTGAPSLAMPSTPVDGIPSPAPSAAPNQTLHAFPRDRWNKELVEWFVTKINKMIPMDASADSVKTPPDESSAESGYWFVVNLLSEDSTLLRRYTSGDYPAVKLMVHHMMDIEPSFHSPNIQESEPFYPFPTKQLEYAKALDARVPAGKSLVRFVAWNPFRSGPGYAGDWKDGNPASLQIVRQAIADGAQGVKFYPPLGYRPLGNAEHGWRSLGWFSGKDERLEWDTRYHGWTPADLDALNRKLFAWCEKNRIPIFSHTGLGEFQADAGYWRLANPDGWELVLKDYPNLILCFGHSGEMNFWLGTKAGGNSFKWGEKIFELCRKYPNVYCEFGILEQLVDDGSAAQFAARMSELAATPCDYDPAVTFGDKIMYGSDWFMPMSVSPRDFLASYERAFSTSLLAPYRAAFFSKNAHKYLGLR